MADGILRGLGIRVDLEGNGDEELRAWMRDLAEARGGSESFAGSLNDMEREMIEAAKKIGLGREEVKALIEQHRRTGEIQQFADKYGMAMGEVQKRTKDASREISQFGQVVQTVMAAGVGARMFGLGREMVGLASDYETASVRFKVMLGSAEQAQQVMSDINRFSNETPYEPDEVLASAQQLINARVPLSELQQNLRMVGDVAAGTGIRFQDLATIFAKNRTSGVVQMDDINQLAGRGVPIFDELARVMGVSAEQVRQLSSKGAIRFAHLQQAFQNMSAAGGKYHNMMGELAQTSAGKWSTLQGNITSVKRSFGMLLMDGLAPVLDVFLAGTQYILEHSWALTTLKGVAIALSVVIGIIMVGAMKAAMASAWSLVVATLAGFKLMIINILLGAASMSIFSAATWTAVAPFLIIILVIGTVIGVIALLYDWISGGESILGDWFGSFDVVLKNIQNLFTAAWDWIQGLVAKIFGFFKKYGKYIIMALFPVSILFFYWRQISNFLMSIPGKIVAFFSSIPDKIMGALQSLGSRIWKFLKGILPDWAIKMVAKVTGEQIEARAGGGPVDSGRPYIVGEEGPELFVPRGSGNIVPNGAVVRSQGSRSSSITISQVLNFNAPVTREDGEYIKRKLEEAMEAVIPMVRAKLGLEVG